MIKLLYKPVSMLVSVLGGILAGAIFKQVWKMVGREDDAPKAPRPAGLAGNAAGRHDAGRDLRRGQGRCRPERRRGHAQAHRRLAGRRRRAIRPGGATMTRPEHGNGADDRRKPGTETIPRRTRYPAVRTRRWTWARPAGETP
jgi:Protein of unknown function (DUF4235)